MCLVCCLNVFVKSCHVLPRCPQSCAEDGEEDEGEGKTFEVEHLTWVLTLFFCAVAFPLR